MALKLLRTGDADLDRVQQNVAAALAAQSQSTSPVVTSVTTDVTLASDTDFLAVDSSRGPVRVTLPTDRESPVTVVSVTKTGRPITFLGAPVSGPAGVQNVIPAGAVASFLPINGVYYYTSLLKP